MLQYQSASMLHSFIMVEKITKGDCQKDVCKKRSSHGDA